MFSMMSTSNSSFELAAVSFCPSGARLRVSQCTSFCLVHTPLAGDNAEALTSFVAIFAVPDIMVFGIRLLGVCGQFGLFLSCRIHTGEI